MAGFTQQLEELPKLQYTIHMEVEDTSTSAVSRQ
jgi:hypothetical protein